MINVDVEMLKQTIGINESELLRLMSEKIKLDEDNKSKDKIIRELRDEILALKSEYRQLDVKCEYQKGEHKKQIKKMKKKHNKMKLELLQQLLILKSELYDLKIGTVEKIHQIEKIS